jgi:hypothetical protein
MPVQQPDDRNRAYRSGKAHSPERGPPAIEHTWQEATGHPVPRRSATISLGAAVTKQASPDRSAVHATCAEATLPSQGQALTTASAPDQCCGNLSVAEIAKSIKMGPGMEPGTQMGPLVSEEQFRRVTGYLESGKSDGATALAGGGRHGDRGYFVEPTVLTNTRPDMKVVREEIFSPVLVASPFTDLDEIAGIANDSEYGLGAGIWTRDITKAHALAKKLRAGTVWINCYNVFDAALPFGGYKQSGWGREMGHQALEAYTEVKAVTTQL